LTDKISDKDKLQWEKFLSSEDRLPDKDLNLSEKKSRKSTTKIDLHGFSLEEANFIISKFINKSFKENYKKIIVITGKGIHSQNEKNPYVSKDYSILKYSIPEFIKKDDDLIKKIVKITDADIKDGGSGAFYIYLKNNR
tara:strand:+ start:139 stop:555 length:417 start_codon:yes stop_codon:yes gene_type:complete